MQDFDEGYIKYVCNWQLTPALEDEKINQLIHYRNQLRKMNLLGVYPNRIGFGNISSRVFSGPDFYISGTQTSAILVADESHFCKVYNYDIGQNALFCKGPVKASSEALTHAAMYDADTTINSIIHIHNPEYWRKLLFNITTIPHDIAYGTIELANYIKNLIKEDDILRKDKIFVTAGHEDGIFVFGNSLIEAFNILNETINTLK